MAKKKHKSKPLFNRSIEGIYGELGAGSGVRVNYIQTTLHPDQLDWTTLISNIEGSEKWPVRDLFQREVDDNRVTNSLLPFLSDPQQIKFFNPLTLSLLPVEAERVMESLPVLVREKYDDDGDEQNALTYEGFYRFRHYQPDDDFGYVDWNDLKTKLVAIDGQHRLTALKRLRKDADRAGKVNFSSWRIPVIILGFQAEEPQHEQPGNLLEAVRRIFVHINREAKPPNRARTILLTDESVNALATQELLQRSHGNDVQPEADRDESVLPLLFYDWRGEEEDGRRRFAPASVKSVEEVHDWIAGLILGEDFSTDQGACLDIEATDDLKEIFAKKRLPPRLTDELRERLNRDFVPALANVLERFVPYRTYSERLRALERENCEQSDAGKHAFDLLRFGQHRAEQDQADAVWELYRHLQTEISRMKLACLLHPLDLDIGMRGVMSAFGELATYHEDVYGPSSWTDYAAWFVNRLNEAYEAGWLEQAASGPLAEHQRHIIVDHADTVVNYRISDARNAFGALIGSLLVTYDFAATGGHQDEWEGWLEQFLERLRTTMLSGYKKEIRPQLKKQFPDGGKPLTDAVRAAAEEQAETRVAELEVAIRSIV